MQAEHGDGILAKVALSKAIESAAHILDLIDERWPELENSNSAKQDGLKI